MAIGSNINLRDKTICFNRGKTVKLLRFIFVMLNGFSVVFYIFMAVLLATT